VAGGGAPTVLAGFTLAGETGRVISDTARLRR